MDPAVWSGEVDVVDVLQTIQQFSTGGVVVRGRRQRSDEIKRASRQRAVSQGQGLNESR